jgi:WD40 repeat protein
VIDEDERGPAEASPPIIHELERQRTDDLAVLVRAGSEQIDRTRRDGDNLDAVGVVLANSDGSDPRQLPSNANVGAAAGPPNWSGDGSHIAFGVSPVPCGYHSCDALGYACLQGPCGGAPIIEILVSSGTTKQLTRPTGLGSSSELPMDENPAWSPDDQWLVFDRSGAPQGGIPGEGIWRVHDDGSCLKRIAGDLRDATRDTPRDPVWRPGAGSPNDACS